MLSFGKDDGENVMYGYVNIVSLQSCRVCALSIGAGSSMPKCLHSMHVKTFQLHCQPPLCYAVWQVPADRDYVTSGVYELMSTGTLSSGHQDHPANRSCTPPGSNSSSSDAPAGSSRNTAKASAAGSAADDTASSEGTLALGCSSAAGYTSASGSSISGGSRLQQHVFHTAGLQLVSSYYQAHGRCVLGCSCDGGH